MKRIFTFIIGLLLMTNLTNAQDLVLTAVYDGPLTGGTPKGVELYATGDIADLSAYGLGSANNGGGSDGEEYTFPADAVSAGDYIYVATEDVEFANWFGFAPDYTSGAMAINGDDAVELFYNGAVIDVYGDQDVDGSGEPWEYLDGWAYRVDGTGPDAVFVEANWTYSGPNALDGEASNATAATPVPVGTYAAGASNDVATPVINPASGSYTSTISVNMTCATADANIYYTLDGSEPTEASTLYAAAFDVSTTTTVKARAYKAGMTESGIATNQYDFPIEVATIAELRANAGSADTYILVGEAVVTFAQGYRNQKYIQDATAAILIDDDPGVITNDYVVGDAVVNIVGTLNEYGNMLQFQPSDQGTETSSGNTVTPEVVTLTELTNNFEDYEAELVKVMDVEFQDAGTFANGTVYEIQNVSSDSYNFRTSFYDVDYIGTGIPTGQVDLVAIANSRTDGEYITSRNTADMTLDPGTVATPAISPNGGDFVDPVSVTITCATDGATIYYTLDGSEPTTASTEYTAAFEVSTNTTVKAKAFKSGMADSGIASADFTFPTEVANLAELRAQAGNAGTFKVVGEVIVTFAQDFRNQKYIQDATAAILIDDDPGLITNDYVIGDGVTGLTGELSEYGGMIQFLPTNQGTETSQGNSINPEVVTIDELTANFEDYEAELIRLNEVTFQDAGTFENGTVYELQNTSADSYNFRSTFYDVDYIGQSIPADEIDLIGIANSRTDGEYVTSRFFADMLTDPGTVATPVISPGAGVYTDPITVSITCATPGATIHYTLDGSNPTPASTEYTAPFVVSEETTVKAVAFASGLNQSGVASVTYTFSSVIEVANLAELRAQAGTDATYRVTGEVVVTFAQDFRNQKYIQDATAAILIDDDPGVITADYVIGDGITNIEGSLTEYGGMLQFNPENDGELSSTGNTITPQEVSFIDIINEFEEYEAELVSIYGVNFTETGVFETGTVYEIKEYGDDMPYGFRTTFYDADFIGSEIPEGYVNIVGIMNSRTDGEYISARMAADITPSDVKVNTVEANEFTMMPNPASDMLKIELASDNASVEIYDVCGKLVAKRQATGTVEMSVSNLYSGIYFVKVVDLNSGNATAKKLIVK